MQGNVLDYSLSRSDILNQIVNLQEQSVLPSKQTNLYNTTNCDTKFITTLQNCIVDFQVQGP